MFVYIFVFFFSPSAFWRLITILVTDFLTLSLPVSRFHFLLSFWTKRCKLKCFFISYYPSLFSLETSSEQWMLCSVSNNNHMLFFVFVFISVNIISWFTWVSLFNNVLLSIFLFLFSVIWHERVSVLNDSLNGGCAAHVWVCVCVCVGVFFRICVSRAISGVGFALFFVYYICFFFFAMLYLRCMSPVFGWVSFLCLHDVAVVGLVVVVMVINAGLNCMFFSVLSILVLLCFPCFEV